jgi:hypothetical protein
MTRAAHPPRCAYCKRTLGRARLFINNRWTCSDCEYRRERGETVTTSEAPPSPRRRMAPRSDRAQGETLFPLDEYETQEEGQHDEP